MLENKNGQIKLPPKIKILTWNYDNQLELAYNYFVKLEEFSDVLEKNNLNVYPGLTINNEVRNPDVIHLNGMSGLFGDKNNNARILIKNYLYEDIERFLDKRTDIIHGISYGEKVIGDSINFCWEESIPKNIEETIIQIMVDTDVFIIIGYSFPFFNRFLDRLLIESLLDKPEYGYSTKAFKIYYQDKNLDGSFLSQQYDVDQKIITHIKQTDQFYLPYEL